MRQGGLERYAPLTGLVFVIMLVVLIIFGQETPDVDDPAREIASFWRENDDDEIVFTLVAGIASLFFVWFAGSLRSAIWHAEGGSGRLATLSFGGALLLAAGFLTVLGIDFAVADAADESSAQTILTLNALNNGFFLPLAGGALLFLLASGIALVRVRPLPVWLGWFALLLALVFVTPIGFVSFFGALIWIAIVSVLLYRQGDPGQTSRAPAASPGSPS